jgi:transposase
MSSSPDSVVRRADGYYGQFCIDIERIEKREPTGKTIGLDVGLTHLYTDSDQEFLDGRSPRIYPWNQSKIENRKSSSPRIYPWGQSKI